MSKHVVILASINTDITASAVRLPERGETVEGYSVDMFGGRPFSVRSWGWTPM